MLNIIFYHIFLKSTEGRCTCTSAILDLYNVNYIAHCVNQNEPFCPLKFRAQRNFSRNSTRMCQSLRDRSYIMLTERTGNIYAYLPATNFKTSKM